MRAMLIRHEKFVIKRRFVVEISVHEVHDSKQYPDKLKWALICIDQNSGKRVLMDPSS